METAIIFTANSQTGNMARISSAVKRLGYKLINITMQQNPAQSVDLITLTIDSNRHLVREDFSTVVAKLGNVVQVDVASQTIAPTTPQPTLANIAMSEDNKAAFIKNEGRQLVAQYPDIRDSLIMLESSMSPATRSELMMRLGTAIGQWQYKKVYSGNGRLDKTVKSSLKMQSAQFGGLPVISDLISTGAKKKKARDEVDPLEQLAHILSDFLRVDMNNGRFTVSDCPHCAVERSPWEPDCHFIKGLMQGFLLDVASLKGAAVSQLSSKAMGGDACVFDVRR